jgi:hypothetical protein
MSLLIDNKSNSKFKNTLIESLDACYNGKKISVKTCRLIINSKIHKTLLFKTKLPMEIINYILIFIHHIFVVQYTITCDREEYIQRFINNSMRAFFSFYRKNGTNSELETQFDCDVDIYHFYSEKSYKQYFVQNRPSIELKNKINILENNPRPIYYTYMIDNRESYTQYNDYKLNATLKEYVMLIMLQRLNEYMKLNWHYLSNI